MRLLWNNEDETEVSIIKDIHDTYVADFKKKNSKAKLHHKDRKVFLPFNIASTLTEKSYTEAWFPPKEQPDEYRDWVKKKEDDDAAAEAASLKKQLAELTAKSKEAERKRKLTKKELNKSKKGRYEDDDNDGVVSDASWQSQARWREVSS
eukprot:693487-Rhodomonas_salina.1